MHQILPKPDWSRLSLFENSKLFRSEFGSFDRLIDPDHKTLISEEALGIGNHLIFGISEIGSLSSEKKTPQISDTRMTVLCSFQAFRVQKSAGSGGAPQPTRGGRLGREFRKRWTGTRRALYRAEKTEKQGLQKSTIHHANSYFFSAAFGGISY